MVEDVTDSKELEKISKEDIKSEVAYWKNILYTTHPKDDDFGEILSNIKQLEDMYLKMD